MNELQTARDALNRNRVAALNRQKITLLPPLTRQLAARLRRIDAQIEAIDKQQKMSRSADSDLEERFDILTSIPCVGDITANAPIVELPELGDLDQGQVASPTGLAPAPKCSGKSSGKRSIRKGRARARQALYMPALGAKKFLPPCKAKHEQLIEIGKPEKVALVAIMREMAFLANAPLRDRRKWSPNRP